MKKQIMIMALIAILHSCQLSNDRDNGFVYNINLDDATVVEWPKISEFCNDVKTIILETTDEAMLSGIKKLIHVNNQFYIFDINLRNRSLGFVAKFDTDGKFARRYGNVGRGPGEYIGISDISVDEQNGLIYLLDYQTRRLISYDLENGSYFDDVRVDKNGMSSNAIVPIGGLIYSDLLYRKFEESNYMLKSWSKADPAIENYYLPMGEHLKGWTNTRLSNNNNFIYNHRNQYALFSNKFSPEIFKLTEEGISNYIYIDSEYFIDPEGRQIISEAWDRYTSPGALPKSPSEILWDLDCFYEIGNYFETDRYICFLITRGNSVPMFIYDKNTGITQRMRSLSLNLIVKSEYPEANDLFMPLCADNDGMFYFTRPEKVDKLRTAAREGMLVDDLDKLDELKELKDYSNPVLFYMKFKEPLK